MKFTKGQSVIVTDYKGKTHLLRVWDETEDRVLITSDAGFQALESGDANLFPIGFPHADVSPMNDETKLAA